MSVKIKPLGDRILVERKEEKESKSVGGIIIPDTAKEKPTEGKVIAVGKGRRLENGTLIPPNVKEGDRILYGKWSGSEVKVDGKEYLIMNESDIYGVIE
ncbi:MAG: co-chaperone GroES [Candidatus Sumerlaeota bacterium]|nr:co-chaperone GroES [Candidatus Sumerlaeota bacterium]